jgi:hypothetical protein
MQAHLAEKSSAQDAHPTARYNDALFHPDIFPWYYKCPKWGTRRYINHHFMVGPMTIHDDPDGLKEHLVVSRTLTSGPYLSESDAFQQLVARQIDSFSELQSKIEEYWSKFPVESDYWQRICNRNSDNLLN